MIVTPTPSCQTWVGDMDQAVNLIICYLYWLGGCDGYSIED